MPKLSYSVREAAEALSIGVTKTYELINEQRLPVVRIDGRTLIRHADLEALLERHLTI